MDARCRAWMAAGLTAFDRGAFFEAHERWEDAWRVLADPERTWVQGLIQLAAALLKMEGGAFVPCGRLATRAAEKLRDAPDVLEGVDAARARTLAAEAIAAAAEHRRLDPAALRLGPRP